MIKTVLKIDGMMCGMCESHLNDAIRSRFAVSKVTSSHAKGLTEILSDTMLDENVLREIIAATGYTLLSVESSPFEKKRFSLFGRK